MTSLRVLVSEAASKSTPNGPQNVDSAVNTNGAGLARESKSPTHISADVENWALWLEEGAAESEKQDKVSGPISADSQPTRTVKQKKASSRIVPLEKQLFPETTPSDDSESSLETRTEKRVAETKTSPKTVSKRRQAVSEPIASLDPAYSAEAGDEIVFTMSSRNSLDNNTPAKVSSSLTLGKKEPARRRLEKTSKSKNADAFGPETQEQLLQAVIDDPDDMDYEPSYHSTRTGHRKPATPRTVASAESLRTPARPLEPIDAAGISAGKSGKRPRGRPKRPSLAKLPTPEWEKPDWDPDAYVQNRAGTSGSARRRGAARPDAPKTRNSGATSVGAETADTLETRPRSERVAKGNGVPSSVKRGRGRPRKDGSTSNRVPSATVEVEDMSSSAESEVMHESIRVRKRRQTDANHQKLMGKIFPERRKQAA